MIRKIKYKGFAIPFFVIISLCCICGAIPLAVIQACNRQNEIPLVEVYPNSQLIEQTVRDFGSQRMVTMKYIAHIPHTELLAYFDEKLACNIDDSQTRATCKGTLADGTDEYFIYLAPDKEIEETENSYTAEISWRGCNWSFQMTK